MIKIKRAYLPAEKRDGYRVLIDRLWPRGIKKSDLLLDEWTKVLAPTTELRKNFGHEVGKWASFQKKYKGELKSAAAKEKIQSLAKRAVKRSVTLIYSAKDTEHNDAVVLKQLLDREVKKLSRQTSGQ